MHVFVVIVLETVTMMIVMIVAMIVMMVVVISVVVAPGVSMRLDGTHAYFPTGCESLMVIIFGLLNLWRIIFECDVTK